MSAIKRAIAILLTWPFVASTFAQTPDLVTAQKPSGAAAPIELFVEAKIKYIPNSDSPFPSRKRTADHEGWAEVSLMVDPKGKPYEIAITKSNGSKQVEEEVLKIAQSMEFTPASFNGQPIDSATEFKLTIKVKDQAARKEFVSAYLELVKAIDKKDRVAADAAMGKLLPGNLYEDAYVGLAEFKYANLWGTVDQQLEALDRAVAREDSPRFLPKQYFEFALRNQLALQLAAKDFADAGLTVEKMKKLKFDRETQTELQSIAEQLEAVRTGHRSYTVAGKISNSAWFYRLFKKQFRINVTEGRISQLKLACDKKFVFFQFDPALDYKIDDQFGKCFLTVVGDAETKFDLVQM